MSDLPDSIDKLEARLNARLANLERRIYALEQPAATASSEPAPVAVSTTSQAALPVAQISRAGSLFPVLGKAMLGVAGAYLLRAVAEANIAPLSVIAPIAIAYAILWLVWAVRVPADAWFASTTYACTSALILAPMLWELTLRFKVLPASATAVALAVFVASAFALNFKTNRAPVLWLANATAAAMSVALSIASHDFAPFVVVLLFMVLLSEAGAAFDRWGNIRMLSGGAADLATWILIYIYSSPQVARSSYQSLGALWLLIPGTTLFLICAAGVFFKSGLRRKNISTFGTVQTSIAFLLAASSLLYFGPPASAAFLGVLCILLSAVGYTSIFTLFKSQDQVGNSSVFSTWSAALLLAGCFLSLPPSLLPACLGVAAVVATIAGAKLNRLALELHGTSYLIASAAAAGLFAYLFHVLAGTIPSTPSINVFVAAACCILCYAVSKSSETEGWKPQVLHLAIAAFAAVSATALLVQASVGLVALRVQLGAHHLAFIRTLILCAAALALAFGGAQTHRRELTRIGYAALVLVAIKLVVEDLPLGHLAYIAASIFLFALTLIAVPRVAHRRQEK